MLYLGYFIVAMAIFNIGVSFWANNAKPDKTILKKYSKKTLFQSTNPFCQSWGALIDEVDMEIMKNYRRRFSVLYMVTALFFISLLIIILNFEYFYNLSKTL